MKRVATVDFDHPTAAVPDVQIRKSARSLQWQRADLDEAVGRLRDGDALLELHDRHVVSVGGWIECRKEGHRTTGEGCARGAARREGHDSAFVECDRVAVPIDVEVEAAAARGHPRTRDGARAWTEREVVDSTWRAGENRQIVERVHDIG